MYLSAESRKQLIEWIHLRAPDQDVAERLLAGADNDVKLVQSAILVIWAHSIRAYEKKVPRAQAQTITKRLMRELEEMGLPQETFNEIGHQMGTRLKKETKVKDEVSEMNRTAATLPRDVPQKRHTR